MSIYNKTIKSYLFQLVTLGVLNLIIGIVLAFLAFAATMTTPIFIPLTLTISILSYYILTFVGKGGNVNYYFKPHTANKNEQLLNHLIIKYRSVFWMTIFALFIIILEIYFQFNNISYSEGINTDNLIGSLIGSIAVMVCTCQGVKFISTWINIKRNWKKEFGKNSPH